MDFLSKNIPTVARVKKQIRCKKIAIKKLEAKLEQEIRSAKPRGDGIFFPTSYRISTRTADRLWKEKSRLAESKLLLAKLKANRWRATTIFEAEQVGLDLRRTFLRLFEAFGEPTTNVFVKTPHRGVIFSHASMSYIGFKIVKGTDGSPVVVLSRRCWMAEHKKEQTIAFIFGPDGISTLEEDGYYNNLFFRPPSGEGDAAKVWNHPGEMSPEIFGNLVEMFRRVVVAVSYRNSPGYNFDFE